MKKILYLTIGLTAGMFLGNVGAVKNSFECIYGNCGKDKFVIMEKKDLFFIGNVKPKEFFSGLNAGFFVWKDMNRGQYIDLNNEYIVEIRDKSSVGFGQIGKNKNNTPCLHKGYAFNLDLSGYQEVKDETCKPLE